MLRLESHCPAPTGPSFEPKVDFETVVFSMCNAAVSAYAAPLDTAATKTNNLMAYLMRASLTPGSLGRGHYPPAWMANQPVAQTSSRHLPLTV